MGVGRKEAWRVWHSSKPLESNGEHKQYSGYKGKGYDVNTFKCYQYDTLKIMYNIVQEIIYLG